jgi:hypothetical protein
LEEVVALSAIDGLVLVLAGGMPVSGCNYSFLFFAISIQRLKEIQVVHFIPFGLVQEYHIIGHRNEFDSFSIPSLDD